MSGWWEVIQRQDCWGSVCQGIEPNDTGDFVLYADHLAAMAKLERDCNGLSLDCAAKNAALASLHAELAEARRDAERYRWLRGEVNGPHVPLAQVVWKLNNARDGHKWTNFSDGQALDAAIDAARGEP